jgi:hypothetical protein
MQMAFSEFKNIAEVQKKYQIKYQEEHFMANKTSEISKQFLDNFNFCRENIDIFSSEASRCEIIISPLLREVYKHHYINHSFWIQKYVKYDDTLSGAPDYLFSRKSELGKTVLEKPLLVVAEAKKNDFEQGWGQCLAEMVACQKINEDTALPIYGIVTDGNLWQFGQLVENTFIKELESFTIDKLNDLYGALEYIFQLTEIRQTNKK